MSADGDLKRVLLVCTREIPREAESGRERTMAFILQSLEAGGEVKQLRLHSALERRSAGRIMRLLAAAAWGVLTLRPIPLQALLFHAGGSERELDALVAHLRPETVVFDGVRSGQMALGLRARFPSLRIVCDFDDLMSRRMEVLARTGQPISMGYLRKMVPAWVQRCVLDGLFARLILSYEHRALRAAEGRIGRACDDTVLVSSVDAGHLRSLSPGVRVSVVPPYMGAHAPFRPLVAVERFVFIGGDSLLQNRQAIEFLVSLWARARPATPLHIFGKQGRIYPEVPGVVFRGFVADVADAYLPGSVLLAPSFLSGGVKTKVLEAMSYGIVPLGTEVTFEGIEADFDGLTGGPAQIEEWVCDPARYVGGWAERGAAAIGQAACNHAEARLGKRWRTIVWPNN